MTLIERARLYVAKMDAAVSGSHGHDATFKVAIALRHGFGLTYDEALPLMQEYNERCRPKWNEKDLNHKLEEAVRVQHTERRGHLAGPMDRAVRQEEPRRMPVEPERNWREFDPEALAREQTYEKIGKEWLWKRSPVDCRTMAAGTFLTHVSEIGDRLLVFTNERSQGQYLFWNDEDERRRGWYRLADRRGVSAAFTAPVAHTPSDLMWAPFGVWWLCQPVTGEWKSNGERWSRRSAGNVTDWRTMVIESDEEGIEPAWLNLLVQLPLRITALYTSGCRSVHALVRVNMPSKALWDQLRERLKPMLTRFGADRGVFSAIRLTRLPGCFRMGKCDRQTGRFVRFSEPRMQRLLYLNPQAEARPLIDLPVLRSAPMWEEAYA